MSLIAVSGGSGFLGSAILTRLSIDSFKGIAFVRTKCELPDNFTDYTISSIDENTDYRDSLDNVSCVIHTAARVHIMEEECIDALNLYRQVNTVGTLNFARQAVSAGVRRFIYISSIKVNGEFTVPGVTFKADDECVPDDPYGLSKYEAELGLRQIASESDMEVVIIRPPLIYGPGVKANFKQMMKWLVKGIPLPLGAIENNKRSLVSMDNLVDLITVCINHPQAANQTFLVSDDDDVSTTKLLKSSALALQVPSRLLPIPIAWFSIAARVLGKPALVNRLCGSLQVDISKTKKLLNWHPKFTFEDSLKKTADAFLKVDPK